MTTDQLATYYNRVEDVITLDNEHCQIHVAVHELWSPEDISINALAVQGEQASGIRKSFQ